MVFHALPATGRKGILQTAVEVCEDGATALEPHAHRGIFLWDCLAQAL
jgi:hypothetical protein